MKFINLTPHALIIYNEQRELVAEIKPSGHLARISVTRDRVDTVDGIPIFNTHAGEPEGLPDQAEGIGYVVSGIFRSIVGRSDLFQPGELVRDEKGQPIGCVGLSQ